VATANAMIAAIYSHLDNEIATEISPRWRRQGEPLPFITYEVQNVDWVRITGAFTNCAEIQIAFSCIAETLTDALAIADEIRVALGKTTVDDVTFGATQIGYRVADATPDDGTGDTERVVVVNATIFTQDEN
jgi:hypothetical protein